MLNIGYLCILSLLLSSCSIDYRAFKTFIDCVYSSSGCFATRKTKSL